ncbi:MAG: hypothetical protein HRU09_03640 [Oligoflexales bacterium]|nr:hypothetical protein [Oligoflexales bacterium]
MSSNDNKARDLAKENAGWLQICGIIILFPILFFACVWFPMWMGWAQRFP